MMLLAVILAVLVSRETPYADMDVTPSSRNMRIQSPVPIDRTFAPQTAYLCGRFAKRYDLEK